MVDRQGTLFYLMGPSGSGKDSLLSGCREHLARGERPVGKKCFIAHRYITRRPELRGENHVWLSDEEFDLRVKSETFSMHWLANGYSYGVGIEIDDWLEKGIDVMLNGSRGYLPKAIEKYGDAIVPIQIHVDSKNLRRRLVNRGRETKDEIDRRIARSTEMNRNLDERVHFIDNNGSLISAIDALVNIMDSTDMDVKTVISMKAERAS